MEVSLRNSAIDQTQREDERLRIAASFVRETDLLTPFFFFEESELEKSLSYFNKYLPRLTLYYAVKANPHPLLLRYFVQKGLSFDVASAQEVELLRGFGTSGDKIIFTNPNKQMQCVRSLFENDIYAFAYDTIDEVRKIAGYAAQNGISQLPKALLRVRVESKDVQIDLNKKFGCSLEDAADLVKAAHDLGIDTIGLAFHVGTQSFSAHNFVVGIKSSMLVARAVKEQFGINMRIIDIGGGFPDQKVVAHVGITYDSIFAEIATSCEFAEHEGFQLCAEPGRMLVSGAGNLVTSVIGIADRGGRRSIYLNDGSFGCYSGKFFDYKHFEFLPVAGPDRRGPFSRHLIPCTVWGPTCDSLDLIEEEVMLPSDLAVGDYICSPEMGAYSYGCATNYNGFHVRAARFISLPTQLPEQVLELAVAPVSSRVVSLHSSNRKRKRSKEMLLAD
jgi:ornithine decarboxylase